MLEDAGWVADVVAVGLQVDKVVAVLMEAPLVVIVSEQLLEPVTVLLLLNQWELVLVA